MKIQISAEDLKVAVKEYVLRRGLPDGVDLDVFVRGGRRGNSGTAEVTVVPKVGPDVSAPQIFENVFAPIEAVEAPYEIEAENHSDVENEYFNTTINVAADLADFDKPSLKVIEPKQEEPEPEEEPEYITVQREINEVKATKRKLGSLFGADPVEVTEEEPKKKPANPFK